MSSLILRTTSRLLVTLFLLFSIFLLGRGHDAPGGGFVGGLVGASTFVLHGLAHGVGSARRALRVDPQLLIPAGLLLATSCSVIPLLLGEPISTAQWGELRLGSHHVPLGTPLLFDLGVYLVVVGVTLTIIFSLAEK